VSKYMLLIYNDDKRYRDVTAEEQGAISAEYYTFTQSLIDAGAMVGGEPLESPETARVVAQDGVVTDGPFAETSEHLGGFYIVEVGSIEDACTWAAKLPGVTRGLDRIEVREVRVLPEMPDPS
jgi:hypothetical protein